MAEQWKPLVGLEGRYEISSEGRVYSHLRGRILKPTITAKGYAYVRLNKASRHVAREMLKAFVGQPEPGQQACHNNGIPGDNRLNNLRWDTPHENMLDIIRHGRNHWLNQTHCKHGHEFTPENTHHYKRGERTERRCRACRYIRTKNWKAKTTP